MLLVALAVLPATVRAADIDFKFEIPTIPFPPQISNVQHMPPCAGAASFEVSATIVGQAQKKAVCDIVPREDCEASDWYLMDDSGVTPNPPVIATARVYYYLGGDISDTKFVSMARESGSDTWKADVPLAGVDAGTVITYFITSVDTRGNVASQVPDPFERPAQDVASWDATLSTPGIDSCSFATSYSQCNINVSSAPGACSANYTLADRQGDVCGQPDASGNQVVITGSNADRMDLLGISAGADSKMISARMGLGGPPPGPSDPAPIEGYLLIFFNPDIIDPNPADTHITNAYAVTFAPEANTDPTLVKVLWEADCVSNPATPNPLDCRLYAPSGPHAGLMVEYQNGSLRVIVNKSGTGDANLKKSFSLIGGESSQSVLVGLTGEINLSGGTAFWISDITPGFAFYHKNQTVTVKPAGECSVPPCVNITTTLCSTSGTGGTSAVCPHSATQPAQNVCSIAFSDTGSVAATQYRVYRALKGATSGSELVDTITAGGSGSTHTSNNAITSLQGQAYDYFIACWDGTNETATDTYAQTRTQCTVDDWTAPQQPVITSTETPDGSDAICRVSWTADGADVTLRDFLVKRGGQVLNAASPVSKLGNTYVWPDLESLDTATNYSYTVVARDKVLNMSESAASTCRPRDLKAPCQVDSIVASAAPTPDTLGVTLDWSACTDDDVAGYNVYSCKFDNPNIQCQNEGDFTKLTPSLLNGVHFENESAEVFDKESWFRFYVESCDTCTDRNACEARNCSGFPILDDDFKDHFVSKIVDLFKPLAPAGVAASAPAMGKSCKLTWSRVCVDDEGPFDNCDSPASHELVGYKIVRQQASNVPDPLNGTVVATVAAGGTQETVSYTDTGLANGVAYYYKVYAMDGSRNYSEGTHAEVNCTPARTEKPDLPVIQTLAGDDFSCTMDWDPIDDPYSIMYEIHRCDDKMDVCDTPGEFSLIDDEAGSNITVTQYTDNSVVTGDYYTYCVVADAEGIIKSDVYNAANKKNCGQCFAGETIAPPTDMNAWFDGGDATVKVSFTRSTSDQGDGGYAIYRCADDTCAAGATAVKTCTQLAAGSSAIQNISDVNPISIAGEPEGTYYYGATYQPDCTNNDTVSELEYTNTAISGAVAVTPPACANPAKCVVISSCNDFDNKTRCSPVTRKDTTQTDSNGYVLNPQQGYEVYLADKTGARINGVSATTGADGNYRISIDTTKVTLDLSKEYQVILKLPDGAISGQPCSAGLPGDGCLIELNKSVTLKEDSSTVQVRGIPLADCGGGEIGNFNCDATVDITDVIKLKACFGSELGDGKYQKWCDVTGNGTVDVLDFMAIKNNFGLEMDAAPSCRPELCITK